MRSGQRLHGTWIDGTNDPNFDCIGWTSNTDKMVFASPNATGQACTDACSGTTLCSFTGSIYCFEQ